MKNKNIMNISSMRGVFLSAIILCSVVLMLIPSSAYAEELNVKSVSIDEIEITLVIDFFI